MQDSHDIIPISYIIKENSSDITSRSSVTGLTGSNHCDISNVIEQNLFLFELEEHPTSNKESEYPFQNVFELTLPSDKADKYNIEGYGCIVDIDSLGHTHGVPVESPKGSLPTCDTCLMEAIPLAYKTDMIKIMSSDCRFNAISDKCPLGCSGGYSGCSGACLADTKSASGFGHTIGLFIQTLGLADFLFVYGAIIIVSALFIVSYFFGINSTWYINLIKPNVNGWVVEAAWIIATALSYIGLFFLYDNNNSPSQISRNLGISFLFLIGNFLTLAWSTAFFQAQNLELAIWLAVIILIYNFWVYIYILYIKVLAAIFLIPILLMYVYLIYVTIHTASLNNIPI